MSDQRFPAVSLQVVVLGGSLTTLALAQLGIHGTILERGSNGCVAWVCHQ